MNFTETYTKHYDLFYKAKDYVSEASAIHQLIQKYYPGAKTILDLGCGTGNHAIALTKLGYAVTGIDLSSSMITLAKNKSNTPTFIQGDIRTVEFNQQFDVIISLFHVMSYLLTEKDLQIVFQKSAQHLHDNGLFFFDYWDGSKVLAMPPEQRTNKFENDSYEITRIAKPIHNTSTGTIKVQYTLHITNKLDSSSSEISENHLMKYWFDNVLQKNLEPLFTVLVKNTAAIEDAANHTSWNSLMVIKKSDMEQTYA